MIPIWHSYYSDSVPHLAREKGSFWWKDILRLHIQFRGVAFCQPSKGDTVSFWEDLINGHIHSNRFPNLYPFAKEPRLSFWKIRSAVSLVDCFRIPMSREAYNEMLVLQSELQNLPQVIPDEKDKWLFIWGQQKYSSSKFYQHHFRELQPHRVVIWIWKSKCVPKIKKNFLASPR